jgi:peptidylprolyl isomerase
MTIMLSAAAPKKEVSRPAAKSAGAKVFCFFFSKRKFFLAFICFALAAADQVVAVRGTDELTAAQVRALVAATPPDQRRKLAASPEALKGLITDTLLQHAILAEAAAQKWDQRPDVAAMLARVRESAILQSFIAAQSQPPAGYPSEADVLAAYAQARPQLTRPRTYHLAQDFVPLAANAPAGASEAARRALAMLARDISAGRVAFDAVPKRNASVQYADLGWVADTQLQKAAHDTVAGLPEGQVSPPICAANGCTLIKLLATRPAGPPPVAEVHDQLVRALRERKQKELAQAYANNLLAKAPVRVDEIQLSHLAVP